MAVLAPAFTTGAISLEREKQTLDLLVTTPLSSLGLVIGKLGAALAYVFLLIFASLPMAAVVFLFGGVGPDDLLRGYLLLVCFAVGFGAIGLFISALVKRTQVATVLTYLTILALTAGTWVVWYFLYATSGVSAPGGFIPGTGAATGRPAQQLLWLNPFVADMDLVCVTAVSGSSDACLVMSAVTGKPYFGSSGSIDCPQCLKPMPEPVPMPGVVVDDASAAIQVGLANAVAIAGFVPDGACPPNGRCVIAGRPVLDVAPVADPDGLPARHVLATVRRRVPDPGGRPDAHLVAPRDAQPSRLAPAPVAADPEASAMTLDPTLDRHPLRPGTIPTPSLAAPDRPRRDLAGGTASWRWSSSSPSPDGWCRSDGRGVRRWRSRSSASSPCSSMPCACDRRSPRPRWPSTASRVSAIGSRPRSRSRCGRPS